MGFTNPISTVAATIAGPVDVSGSTVDVPGGVDINNTPNVNLGTGSQLNVGGLPGQPINLQVPQSYFGSGADGAATIAANTTLTGLKQYSSLTVNAGVTLSTGGYPIYCTGVATINGTIANNAGNGAAGLAGNTGAPGSQYLGGGANGGTGTATTGAPGGSIADGPKLTGGAGGTAAGVSNGAGGTVPTTGLPTLDESLAQGLLAGGAGGGAITSSGGGGGGGVVVLVANQVNGTGQIQAKGSGAPNNTSAGAGGGGLVVVAYATAGTWTSAPNVSVAAGSNGQPGVAGAAFVVQVKISPN